MISVGRNNPQTNTSLLNGMYTLPIALVRSPRDFAMLVISNTNIYNFFKLLLLVQTTFTLSSNIDCSSFNGNTPGLESDLLIFPGGWTSPLLDCMDTTGRGHDEFS